MRWILAFFAILALYVVDRTYLGGENAALASSLLHSAGASINQKVGDLLRPLRR
jgi:hypothetical protein